MHRLHLSVILSLIVSISCGITHATTFEWPDVAQITWNG